MRGRAGVFCIGLFAMATTDWGQISPGEITDRVRDAASLRELRGVQVILTELAGNETRACACTCDANRPLCTPDALPS